MNISDGNAKPCNDHNERLSDVDDGMKIPSLMSMKLKEFSQAQLKATV